MVLLNKPPSVTNGTIMNKTHGPYPFEYCYNKRLTYEMHTYICGLFILSDVTLMELYFKLYRICTFPDRPPKSDVALSIILLFRNISFYRYVVIQLHIKANDIERNPGPNDQRGANSNMKICHVNMQSMKRNRDKINQLDVQLGGVFDIITVSETWLDSSIPNTNFKLQGYQPIFRKDRSGESAGGGVAAWVSDNLIAKERRDLELPFTEALWLEIRSHNNVFLICTVYRPPSEDATFWDNLQYMLDNAKQTNIKHVLIIGDLNADARTRDGVRFGNFNSHNHLTSHINEPTRITNISQCCLDRAVSNMSDLVKDTHILAPLLQNDHCTIGITLKFQTSNKQSYKRLMWDYDKADWVGLNNYISNIQWNVVCGDFSDIDPAAENWSGAILEAAKMFIPNRIVTVRRNDKPWYNSNLRRAKRKVDRIHKRAKLTNHDQAWVNYRRMRNDYIQNCRDAEKKHDNDQRIKLSNCTFSTKKCWNLYKSIVGLSGDTTKSCPALSHNDKVITDSKVKAKIFNELFLEKSFIDDKEKDIPMFTSDQTISPQVINSIEITRRDIADQLGSLDVTKAYGPDGLGPKLLKTLHPVITDSLYRLFRSSIDQHKMPSIWKQANVVPIHKKGDKSNPSNYRPVSLLNTIAKVFEKIVFKYIFNHLRDTSAISIWQSGFVPNCSTTCQLLEIYHKFCQSVESGKEVRVVFLDISRAFDRVWHKGLLYKLQRCGIQGNVLQWISSYLADRQQRVCLDGEFSSWGNISAGVPQGSILGPLLFLIFINDITEIIQFSQIRLFADDTCLFIDVDNRQHCRDLIEIDLKAIHTWSEKWLVNFNVAKTKALTVSNRPDKDLNPPLSMNNVHIENVVSHKHLGVTLTQNLSWGVHIDDIASKAMQRLNIIQSFKFKLARRDLERFYKSFILPVLEYGDVLWDGAFEFELGKLERVQIRAMRIITGATERCDVRNLYLELGWNTLSERRKIHKLKWYYKILNDLLPSYLSDLIPPTGAERHSYGLRNNANITTFRANRQFYAKSYFPSATKDWNDLPVVVKAAPSIYTFNRMLKLHISAPPKISWYGIGNRFYDIHHSRMRIGCSKLKAHLFFNLHVESSPLCACGPVNEDPAHFFFDCPLFRLQRIALLTNLAEYQPFDSQLLLSGDLNLSLEINMKIALEVQTFLKSTKRFD